MADLMDEPTGRHPLHHLGPRSGKGRRSSHAILLTTAVSLALGVPALAAPKTKPAPVAAEEAPSAALRQRIAALALKQVQFGSISLLPVRFEHSRLAGPFEDGGRTLYCVSSHMRGRTFGKAERPKVVMREDKGILTVIDDEEACTGQRSKPFGELDTLKE